MESAESLSCMICVFSYLINYSHGLTYFIPEEKATGTFIGNITKDENLRALVSEEDYQNMQFLFLNLDNQYLNHFSINSSTSILYVKEPMDRETICPFSSDFICPITIEVAAQVNIGSFFKKISVTINIQDINDHPPTFNEDFVSLSISESEVQNKRFELDGALDEDSYNYSVRSYEIVEKNVPFVTDFNQIDDGTNTFRLVVNGELDRETTSYYLLQIVAKDGGVNPLIGTLTVNVTILDDNDNKPIFGKAVYNTTVKENIPKNTTILRVIATDADLGANAEIMYQLSTQQPQTIKDAFEINSTSGEIRVINHLEYTSNNVLSVKIEAVDKGERPQTAKAVVEVTVEDSENNPPQINVNLLSSTDFATTSEYASVGAVVAHVEVSDSDGGRNGVVACDTDSDYFTLQGLESKEYKVIVIMRLDRETIASHNVTIVCYDFGVPKLNSSTSFMIRVEDENDNPPQFAQPAYMSNIKENNVINYTIVQVYATDADIGANGRVSYYLNPSDRDFFTINAKTGLIVANIAYDREQISSYRFPVFAVDAGNPSMSSSVMVNVTVQDVNDNPPVFDKEHFTYYVAETHLRETVLGKIVATDKDTIQNVSYTMVGNTSAIPFEVLPDGTVKTTDMLDRERVDRYDFNVMAIDNGFDDRLSAIVGVTVYVTDINDNYPSIIFPKDLDFVKYITYMMPAKTQVMKVEAEDADDDKNAELRYSIEKRNDTFLFEVGRNGEIYVARRMTEDDINVYTLDIDVSDQGKPPKRTFTRITIAVLDKNVTSLLATDTSDENQNVIIAVVVVVITVVIAATILIIIWVVRRMDMQKQKFNHTNHQLPATDNDSGFSSNGGRKTPEPSKMFGSPLPPSAPSMSPDKMDGRIKDVKFQDEVHVREKSVDSNTTEANNTVQLHRLASLRLHQALLQNKPWTSQTELTEGMKDGKRQEDLHSDMSADTATYDSGIGGSVSDTGDTRLMQLQQMVRQSGRRGQPPHKSQPSNPPRIIARGRPETPDRPPERPPPLGSNPYQSRSPTRNPGSFSPPVSPTKFNTSSPTPVHNNQRYITTSPTNTRPYSNSRNLSPQRQSPSRNVVQDLLMYKKFQNGLKPMHGHLHFDESVDTTQLDDERSSTTSGSYYIDNTTDSRGHMMDLRHPRVSDIYV